MIVAILAAIIVVQTAALVFGTLHLTRNAAEERRFLTNHLLAETPTEFATFSAASRPDETVEALAEARTARPSTPTPLGL
jgi:hypothetical protein